MKAFMRRVISLILVIAMIANFCLTGFALTPDGQQKSAGDVFSFAQEVTWVEAGKQIAGMLSYIVEDAANIDLAAHSARIENLSLEDDSVYLAILAEEGYLPEEPAKIDPAAAITSDEYMQLMEIAFPTVLDSQEAIDSLRGEAELGNIAILGDDLSVTTMLPERVAVAKAQQLSLTAVKASALSLNAGSSINLSESEITRVHIHDTAVKEEVKPGEEVEPDVIYLHMDSGTQLPEVIVKNADEVVIEGSGALGVVRVQEAVGSLTVRATGSVVNETEEPFEVTGPDAEVVELKPGEQVDFVLSKWLVSFVTEGTPVETQEIAPSGMIDFAKASTTLEGKIFTAWYEDADYTHPVSRLGTVDRQMTLYARFVDESEAAVVTFETFGGRKLEPMVFAKGEYLLTKPVESLYTFKEGYSFGGWCVDEDCTTAFGYTDPIEKSMTLYAMYSSYEQEVREEHGTVAEIELPDGAAAIGLVLPEGMTASEAKKSITVEAGTGLEVPEISVRETENGAELYCKAGFTPGTTFTLFAQNGVQFAGYPEYIDTLTVSVFREQVEDVQFAEGLTYVLWDNVTDYTPVSKTAVEYTTDYSEDGTVHNMLENHDAEGDVIPGKLVMTGNVDFQPEQIVVFYDGEINRDEATIDAWEGGDLAGHVLFAEIKSVTANADGTSEVTFVYADPETYLTQLDVHTTEEVNIEEMMDEEQIAQVEKAIASQLSSNDELKAQMMVAVMTSEDTQRMLDEKYGANTYSLAALIPIVSDPKLDIKLSVDGSTATAGIGVGITVSLKGPQGILATLTPYLYFEEQLTLDVNVDGGFLWVDMSVLFKTKTTVSLQLKATTGDGMDNILDEAKTTLEKIVNADGTATEDLDYQEAADTLMNTMQELIGAELEYQDLFAVPLLKFKYTFYGIVTVGINVELVGQAGVVASFGVTVTAEYGQKIGFNYNFLKGKGGSYKEKLGSEVTTEVYLIGKIGVRVGIAVTLYVKLLQNVTVSITGSVYAYVELAGMFMYTYALSAGGGNYAGALYLEVGIDIEIELALEVEVLLISYEKDWTLWSHRWPLYSKSIGMTMSVVQSSELDDIWELATTNSDYKTSFTLPYLPMKTYDMLTAACTENQLLFENLQEGNVTAKLTLENIIINGEPVSSDDPRTGVFYVGDGKNGKLGVVYADELAAAANKVELYQCDVVLTYENKNKSELIKRHRQVFPLSREFKMATTTVNVDITLYDWCAHAWGIEEAEWDNDVVFEATFENTHVLGCPVEPTATGAIDLGAVITAVKERYPEIDGAALSWFNPTLNSVDRTVQYSIPRISNMCYITPESDTVRYDIFATTNDYDLTFNLFASRYPGYSAQITYIIEAPEVPDGVVFTVRGSNEAKMMTFEPMKGEENRWSLTTDRSAFNGSERPIMMSLNGGNAVASGLIVTGREEESLVILTLDDLSSALTVKYTEGIDSWKIVSHDPSEMSAITPGEKVTLSAELMAGYEGLRLTSEPAGLQYTTNGNTVTFTMPSYDVTLTLQGVRYYQANFLYNYGDLGTYRSVTVEKNDSVRKPANPFVRGLSFAGWYDNAACEGEPFDFTRRINGNITLYADWRVNVTVDLGGAEGQARYVAGRRYEEVDGENVEIVESKLVFPGNESNFTRFTYNTRKLGDTALEIILPNYDGYDFKGWYLTSDFSGDPVDPVKYELTGGVIFYARWEKIAILTYELNYGEQEEPYAMALEYVGLPVKNIPEDPQRENYEFLGWFRTKNGGEANRVNLDSYLAEGNMTLYALWKPVEYTITYELNGGENNPANPSSYNIESSEIVFGEPTRKGYRFLGWTATGAEVSDDVVRIPAGSTGNVTLTAKWEPIVYTIRYDLVRGETAAANPIEYTVESADIVLSNPVAKGYQFNGWTGTGLTEPTRKVVIPTGSIGNRYYKANWSTIVSAADIVQSALNAISDAHTMSVNDFTGVQDVKTLALDALAADTICADYLNQISVTATQVGEAAEDDTGYSYTVKVIVSFTDDGGKNIIRNKNVALRVEKNPVTITTDIVYPIGGSYIAYGTRLENVKLTNYKATSGGVAVDGQFEWEDATIIPLAADNGKAIYKLLFTPKDSHNYSTAEVLVAVNTQIGVQIELDVPDTIEYMGRALKASECTFYAADVATGKRIDGATLSITGAVLEQSRVTPGIASVTLAGFGSCELLGVSDTDLYAIVGTEASATVTITRATTILSGEKAYTTGYGNLLNSIALNLQAATSAGTAVDGVFAWENPSTRLGEVGEFTHKVRFTPANPNCYTSATIDVKVTVDGYPGKITYIIEAPDASADSQFTISGAAEAMTFAPVEGEQHRWTLTVNRAAFDGSSEYPILLLRSGSAAIESGLTVTGREADSEVILTLDYIPRKLSVSYTDGLDAWEIVSHDASEMNAIAPGDEVVLSANLLEGYNNLRLTSDPEGLSYISDGNTVTFTMPARDVAIVLRGVRNYQVNCLYNYNDMGVYRNIETAEDGSIVKPDDPSVEGLTFAGWYEDVECKGDPFDFNQQIGENIDLYADWRVNVTVDFGGQKGKAAYYPGETGGEMVPDDGSTPDDGLILPYELIFPGDDSEKERFTYATQRVGETMLNLVIPMPENHVFFGWYLTPDYSDEEVELYGYVLTEGVTFYARWMKYVTLTYMWNDGTDDPYHEAVEYVGMLAKQNPPDVPARDGYEFTGWFRTPACLETDRIDLDTYLVEGDMSLYAGWKPVEYTITYELGGGVNNPANPDSYTIEDDEIVFDEATREGYTFKGWMAEGPVKGNDAFDAWLPAGSFGDATLTARWEAIKYTIRYELNDGEVAVENPAEYTIESDAITLNNPTRIGYSFIGWTGTGLTGYAFDVAIPAGSTGNRSYTANWSIKTPINDIVKAAKNAIPDSLTKDLSDFDNYIVDDAAAFKPFMEDILGKNGTCSDYVGDQLTVTVVQNGDRVEDGKGYTYNATVTVSFTDDDGNVTSESKPVTMRINKNTVTISSVAVVYTVGGKYVPYGTALSAVKLSGKPTDSAGDEVAGTIEWADGTITPKSANNGKAMYKVVFKPDEAWAPYYSTAEISIVVNTQIGVQLRLNVVPESIEYMGRKLNVENPDECGFYAIDMDTGERINNVTLGVTGAVLEQSQLTPGTAAVWLTKVSGCTLTGDFDPNLYTVVSKTGEANGDTVTITRATPVLSGTTEYTAVCGSNLSSIKTNLTAKTKYQNSVAGSFGWETSSALDTVGSFTYKVVFTPSDLNSYTTATIQVTVNVSKQTVTIPTIPSAVYNGTLQKPSLSNTAYYTVVSNSGGTDAGDYTVTLKLRDAKNCMWSDGDENAEKDLTFTITPAPLKVSGNPSVSKLAYGQQLVGGRATHTDKVYRSASDILSNAGVTMEDGTVVAGWWEWTDENYVGKTLNASSRSDNADYGNGYQVLATFHPTSLNAKNFEKLEKTFLVEITRATPDAANCGGYIKEGDIYMPSDNVPVAYLSYFTPVVKSAPVNPNTGKAVSGSLEWESDRVPKADETWANAKFTPSDTKNYFPDIDVKISWKYKKYVTTHYTSGEPFLVNLVNPNGANDIYESRTTPGDSKASFNMLAEFNGDKLCPARITVTDSKGNKLLQTKYYNYNLETRVPTHAADVIGETYIYLATSYVEGNSTVYYTLTFPGNKESRWNCTDINIFVQFGYIDSDGSVYAFGVTYEDYIASGSTYSLRSRSLAPAAMLEPVMDPTPEPTEEPTAIPEPGAIGNVVSVKPKQDAQQSGGLWKIPLEEDQALVEFQWEVSQPASEYFVYTLDENGDPELYIQTTDNSVCLPAEDYETGGNTLYVGAVLEDGSVTWGEAKFELIPFTQPTEKPAAEPTEEAAEEPTEQTTEEPTEETTEEPTEETTEEPTEKPTEEPTEKPTEEPTEETTEEPSEEPTEEPTEKPTEEPTEKPTEEPTKDPTEKPTVEPTPEPTAQSIPEPTPEPDPATPEPIQEAQAAEEAA